MPGKGCAGVRNTELDDVCPEGGRVDALCPVCFAPCPGNYRVGQTGVDLVRTCETHGSMVSAVESDPAFFAAAQRLGSRQATLPGQLVLLATYRCNMACQLCYLPERTPEKDLDTEDVTRILRENPHHEIAFGGGEPTVLDDLPRMIRVAREMGREPLIVTNGLRLAEPGYLAGLVRAGLGGAVLSFNAADGATSRAMDGKDALSAKLEAMQALKRHRVRYSLSTSLVRGMNDHQVGDILRIALRHFPWAKSLLIENCPGIGRAPGSDPVFLSELVSLLAGAMGIPARSFVELAELGKARLDPYSLRFHYGDLLGLRSLRNGSGWHHPVRRFAHAKRDAGTAGALRFAWDSFVRKSGFRIRLLTSVHPGNYARSAVEGTDQSRVACVSGESPVMPLWEYFSRYHGSGHPPLPM